MSQAHLLPSDHSSPSVSLVNGRPATTSREIAKFFGKRHEHVVRSVKEIIDNTPKEFAAPNFGVSEYTDETGRTLPMFTLHRDGFMLLVMGYTGKKAMQIKIAYIQAFNAMEAALLQRTALPESDAKPYGTDAEMRPLDAAVNQWAVKTGKPRLTLLKKLRVHFGIIRYYRFWPVQLIQPAIEWVQEQMGERPTLPKAEQQGVPCAMAPVVDAKTYAYGERLFTAMADLNQKFIMVKDLVNTQGRPGCRLTHLTPEKDALYSNAMDSINMAICALNLAQYGLRVATRIRVSTDFER